MTDLHENKFLSSFATTFTTKLLLPEGETHVSFVSLTFSDNTEYI